MSLVWRKIQRSNKKAAKFRFQAIFQQLTIQLQQGSKWQPDNVAIAWVHRRRKAGTKSYKWEPSITDPFKGIILWSEGAESIEIVTTLYCDQQTGYEDKEWTFLVEATSKKGKTKPVAAVSLNLRLFINEQTPTFTQTEVKLKLRPLNENVLSCAMNLILSSSLEKEGHANDLDMRSLASEISTAANNSQQVSPFGSKDDDVANLASLEEAEGPSGSSGSGFSEKVSEMTDAMEKLLKDPKSEALASVPESPPSSPPIAGAQKSSGEKAPRLPAPTKKPSPRVGVAYPSSQSQPSSVPPTTHSRDTPPTVISSNDSGIGPEPSGNTGQGVTFREAKKQKAQTLPVKTGTMTAGGLLDWCQQITADYRNVKIDNFSDSFRNGMAFCAIVHHFHPESIDYDSLNPPEIRKNCQAAFEAAEKFGVPRLLDSNDFVVMRIPDKIGVMSYVHSLRDNFTRASRISSNNISGATSSNQVSVTSGDSSSILESPGINESLYGLDDIDAQVFKAFEGFRKQRDEADAVHMTALNYPKGQSDDFARSISNEATFHSSRTLQEQYNSKSPSKSPQPMAGSKIDSNSPSVKDSGSSRTTPLMTRKELMNPFDSESDEEAKPMAKPEADTKAEKETDSTPRTIRERSDSSNSSIEKKKRDEGADKENRLSGVLVGEDGRRGSSESTGSGSLTLPSQPLNVQGEARDEELKKRAKELVAQYQAEFEEKGRESTPEEDERKKKLRARARMLIEEARTDAANGTAIPISKTVDENEMTSSQRPATLPYATRPSYSAPNTRDVTPDNKTVTPKFEAYQFRNSFRGGSRPNISRKYPEHSSAGDNSELVRPGVSALGKPSKNLISPSLERKFPGEKEVIHIGVRGDSRSTEEAQDEGTTFDRFKRFGSMRSQELADTVNLLSRRVTTTIRSASVPKELRELTGSSLQTNFKQSVSIAGNPSEFKKSESPVKISSDLDKDLAMRKVALEIEENAKQLESLNKRAPEVEKEWRKELSEQPGSEKEKSLANEYIALLNERNVLIRREEHLGLIEQIQEHEQEFAKVQKEISVLIAVEECDKTEMHKQKIDQLMEKLMVIINKRDELVVRILQNEQGAEEDKSLQETIAVYPQAAMGQDDKNCSIM